jgi:hypothetical protein
VDDSGFGKLLPVLFQAQLGGDAVDGPLHLHAAAGGATKVTAGHASDDGSPILDVLFSSGTVWDGRHGDPNGQALTYNMTDISKARGGIVDTIGKDGTAWEFPWVGDWFPVYAANGNVFFPGGLHTATAVA